MTILVGDLQHRGNVHSRHSRKRLAIATLALGALPSSSSGMVRDAGRIQGDAITLERGKSACGMISRALDTKLGGGSAARALEGLLAGPTRIASRAVVSRGSAHRLVMRALSCVPTKQRLAAGSSRDSAGLLAACHWRRFVVGKAWSQISVLGVAPWCGASRRAAVQLHTRGSRSRRSWRATTSACSRLSV